MQFEPFTLLGHSEPQCPLHSPGKLWKHEGLGLTPRTANKWCRVWPVCLPQATEAAGTEPFRLSQRPQLAFPPISPPNQLATIPAEWIPHGTVSNPRLALHLPDFTGLGWGQVEIFLNPPGDPFAAVLPTSVLDTVTRAGQTCSCTLLFPEPTASALGEEFSGLALLIHCPVRPPARGPVLCVRGRPVVIAYAACHSFPVKQ